jgi:hypothetical protein
MLHLASTEIPWYRVVALSRAKLVPETLSTSGR